MTSPRPRRIGVEPEAVPPDAGLQSERTSLSWARTWAVVAVNIILVAKLVGELSWAWAAAFSALVVVPLLALLRVQRRHEQRLAGQCGEADLLVVDGAGRLWTASGRPTRRAERPRRRRR